MIDIVRSVRLAGSLAILLTAAAGAYADEPRPSALPTVPLPPIQAYGEQNAECLEWTDSCQICRTDEAAKTSCSTPGIACQPGGIVCKVMRKK